MPIASLRRAVRSLLRAPALSIISILTVALGVGAGTALFSVVKVVLLNPLPYPRPERLAWLNEVNDSGHAISVALANFDDWQRDKWFATQEGAGGAPAAGPGPAPRSPLIFGGYWKTRVLPARLRVCA